MQRRDFLKNAAAFTIGASPCIATGAGPAPLRRANSGRKIAFGAAIDVADIDRPDMVELFKAHCTSLTPRNALKWMTNERVEGRPDYKGADRIADFARSIGCTVYGHTLIWYRVPAWVTAMTDAGELRTAMQQRITRTIRHFAGSVQAWDVVNEPMEYSAARWRDSVFQRLLGLDHIRACFELAHETNQNAQLVLNETHLEKAGPMYDARRSLLLDLIGQLHQQGVPLHCIGLQSHFRPGLDQLDSKALGDFCASLKQMGIGVRITELDGSCRFVSRLGKVDMARTYSAMFSDVVRVAGTRGDLRGVTCWGLAEKYQPAENGATGNCRSRVLPYDDDMRVRPAFGSLMSTIEELNR